MSNSDDDPNHAHNSIKATFAAFQDHSNGLLNYTGRLSYLEKNRLTKVSKMLLLKLLHHPDFHANNPFLPATSTSDLPPILPQALTVLGLSRKDLSVEPSPDESVLLLQSVVDHYNGLPTSPRPLSDASASVLLRAYNTCLSTLSSSAPPSSSAASSLFATFPFNLISPDTVTWNTLSQIHSNAGDHVEASRMFQNLSEFDTFSYVTGAKIARGLKDAEAARALVDGFERDYEGHPAYWLVTALAIDTVKEAYEGGGKEEVRERE